MGDATRRAIIARLASGPLPVSEISRDLPVQRPAVSMHLRVLKAAGLVADDAVGNRRYYRLDPDGLARLRDYLDWYWTQALTCYKNTTEAEARVGMTSTEPEIRLLKTITVQAPVTTAFRVFIDQGSWWPVKTHHLAEPAGDTVILEPFPGGRWYERSESGAECDWGRVLAWEPPYRILLTWQIAPGWVYEPDPDRASQIEVRFIAEGPDLTRVEYEHRHLERYAAAADRMRSAIGGANGASATLAAYGRAVARARSS
jgi:uncharacterized protein YndB with AHSA1/START domain/DNA-binding HxlR family transcriptional regulator